jgi:2-polyprenyl-6-methoxyphenol hydroxylase-like FAD-dependent oxidoreductase
MKHKQAIVIGGSMAGLLAARVLSNHFEGVTILERDPLHSQAESRKGQPQTKHLHGLLAQGFNIMTHYFPDLEGALVEGGAIVADVGQTIVTDIKLDANGKIILLGTRPERYFP